jgi:predicted transcriptional regulator
MASAHTSTISARDRARAANAARLAEEQERLKKVEDDLVRFFKAQESREKISDDARARIQRIREETETKIAEADRSGAAAIADLKSRGESVASIAQLTGLTTTEVNKFLRSTKPKQKSEKAPADKTGSNEDSSPASAATSSTDSAALAS